MGLGAIANILNPRFIPHHSYGYCPVCSSKTIFICTDKPELIRNHAVCIRCRSVSRHRAIAHCVLENFSNRKIAKFADFKSRPEFTVFNASSKSSIAKYLGTSANIFNTEYFDGYSSGQYKDGVMCQNLEDLSFESGSIDLVITEDVFEHVREVKKGFQEVHRVLKDGGFHVFSIPFFFFHETKHLFRKEGDEYIPVVLPIEYHGDGIRGQIPAFHHLGYDMFTWLNEIGFETSVHFSEYLESSRIGTYNCYTFVSKKVGSNRKN